MKNKITAIAITLIVSLSSLFISAPAQALAPKNPTAVKIIEAGGTYAKLSWTAPTDTGGKPVLDYFLSYSTDNGATYKVYYDGTSTATTGVIKGLKVNTTYKFKVTAKNVDGYSSGGTVSGLSGSGKPSALRNVQKNNWGSISVGYTWTAPIVNASTITEHKITYSTDGGTTWYPYPGKCGNVTSFQIFFSNVEGKLVQIKIQPVNNYGFGPSTLLSHQF